MDGSESGCAGAVAGLKLGPAPQLGVAIGEGGLVQLPDLGTSRPLGWPQRRGELVRADVSAVRQRFAIRSEPFLISGVKPPVGTDGSAPGLATIEDLAGIGAQVYSALCPNEENKNVESMEAAYRAITDLGVIFGVPDRATERVEAMQRQIADVQAKVAGREPVKVLYYNSGEGPIDTVGGDAFVNELIELAGGVNVFGDTTEGRNEEYFQAPLERVAATSPEVFLINDNSEGEGEPGSPTRGNAKAQYLYKTFPNMPASRDQRVMLAGYIEAEAGWRFVQVVEDLARTLHPDTFTS